MERKFLRLLMSIHKTRVKRGTHEKDQAHRTYVAGRRDPGSQRAEGTPPRELALVSTKAVSSGVIRRAAPTHEVTNNPEARFSLPIKSCHPEVRAVCAEGTMWSFAVPVLLAKCADPSARKGAGLWMTT
jgi:hypothetical protein